ncbi:LOW QUALITY PROTEIN: zinc finger BED domain-containing protein 5-like [Lepisosteus oculatus]|uniref:LOW QUALITY PROTEIN: zinc finger BED domain-containing protein 5-like n=1 Tax=Lepisosteus oculatus TaxID=7918 RepID=UPI0035F5264F
MFEAQFQMAAWANGWSQVEMVGHLAAVLEGKACQALLDVPGDRRYNYAAFASAFQWRFGRRGVRNQGTVYMENGTSSRERKALQRMVNMAQKIISCDLTEIEQLYEDRCRGRILAITEGSHQHGHEVFTPLPSGIDTKNNDARSDRSHTPVEIEEDYTSATDTNSAAEPASVSKCRKMATRRYDPNYLNFGFTYTGTEEEPRPQCVVCYEILSNESMKPAHLSPFTTKHALLKDKPVDFFQRKLKDLKQRKSTIRNSATPITKAQEASYYASLRIAKAGEPRTIGEELCLPLAKEMILIMCGEKAAKQLDLVALSKDTQLDESVDVVNLANLLVYVRYEFEGMSHEDFLFCKPLPTRTTGEHIFQLLNKFIEDNGIDWKKCVRVCTDGARAMTGRHSGVVARIREVAPDMKWTHCSIHREALAAKRMPEDLKSVLDSAVRVVNFIKAQPMNSRLFSVLCNEMGSEHEQLLLYTEVRWLSRGRVLTRLFELYSEVQMFLHDQQSPLASLFDDPVWLVKLAYLADIFSRLNELNMALQGLSLTIFDLSDKITAMKKKLQLFVNKINAGDVSAFPTLENHLHTYGEELDAAVQDVIAVHLLSLKEQFSEYFPVEATPEWIRNPFTVDAEGIPKNLSSAEQEKLLELSSDATLMSELKRQSLLHFWIQRQSEYPALSLKAVQFLMPFATTYLCEKGFSVLTAIKTKYCSKMDAEPDLRLKLTALVPDIGRLCSTKQAHPSH